MIEKIYVRVVEVLKEKLTKEEWVELGEALDGDPQNGLLDLVNDHLQQIAPEVFADEAEMSAFVEKDEVPEFFANFLRDCLNGTAMRMGVKLGAEMIQARDARPCPKCGAPIGEWCKIEGEGDLVKSRTIHKERKG